MYTIHIIRIGLQSRIYNIPKAAQTYATKTQGSLHVHKKLLKHFFNSLNEVLEYAKSSGIEKPTYFLYKLRSTKDTLNQYFLDTLTFLSWNIFVF